MGKGTVTGLGGKKKDRIGDVYLLKGSKKGLSHMQIFLKSLVYLWPRDNSFVRIQFILSFTFMVVSSLLELYAPIPMRQIIADLTPSKKSDSVSFSVISFILFSAAILGNGCASRLRDICFADVGAETERTIGLDTFRHLQKLSLSFHLQRETGAIIRSVSRGMGTNSALIKSLMFTFLPMFIRLVITCIIFTVFFRWYFSATIIAFILCYVIYTLWVSQWRDEYRRTMNDRDDERNSRVFETLMNFETMKYFNADRHEEKRYYETAKELARAEVLTQRVYGLTSMGQHTIAYIGILIILFMAGREVADGAIEVADFVMIYEYLKNLYQPLEQLGKLYMDLKQQILDSEGMFHLLNEPSEIQDKPGAPSLEILPHQEAEIEFRNVSFSYQKTGGGPRVQLINGLSFTIKPGEKVAIVGPSGVGKSTLTRLLYRLYDVDQGAILINGANITDIRQESLRKHIGLVPQDSILFNNTIAYNIGYGSVNHDATIEEIIDVSKRASIDKFITALPNGYETQVGERGLRLSGGEKQRVSIARAVLKDPKILVFDEATSSLDSITESDILTAMNDIAKGRTCLTIAHRLSTVMGADKILVLNKGTLVEMGTHDELLKLENGLYHFLWNRQERITTLKRELEAASDLEIDEEEISVHENQPRDSNVDYTTHISRKNLSSTAKEKLAESFQSQYRYRTFDNPPDADQSDNSTSETNTRKSHTTDDAYPKN